MSELNRPKCPCNDCSVFRPVQWHHVLLYEGLPELRGDEMFGHCTNCDCIWKQPRGQHEMLGWEMTFLGWVQGGKFIPGQPKFIGQSR